MKMKVILPILMAVIFTNGSAKAVGYDKLKLCDQQLISIKSIDKNEVTFAEECIGKKPSGFGFKIIMSAKYAQTKIVVRNFGVKEDSFFYMFDFAYSTHYIGLASKDKQKLTSGMSFSNNQITLYDRSIKYGAEIKLDRKKDVIRKVFDTIDYLKRNNEYYSNQKTANSISPIIYTLNFVDEIVPIILNEEFVNGLSLIRNLNIIHLKNISNEKNKFDKKLNHQKTSITETHANAVAVIESNVVKERNSYSNKIGNANKKISALNKLVEEYEFDIDNYKEQLAKFDAANYKLENKNGILNAKVSKLDSKTSILNLSKYIIPSSLALGLILSFLIININWIAHSMKLRALRKSAIYKEEIRKEKTKQKIDESLRGKMEEGL